MNIFAEEVILPSYRDTYEQAIQYAEDNQLVIKHPNNNQVFLDFDTVAAYDYFDTVLYPLFAEKFKVLDRRRTQSKGGNTHIYLTIDRGLTDIERIAIQAALGSDGKREILSLNGWFTGVKYPSLLFERPDEAKKLEEGLDKQAGV